MSEEKASLIEAVKKMQEVLAAAKRIKPEEPARPGTKEKGEKA